MYAVGGEEVQMNFDVLHSIRGVGAEDIFAWGGDRQDERGARKEDRSCFVAYCSGGIEKHGGIFGRGGAA